MKRARPRVRGSIWRLSLYLACAFTVLGALSASALYARAGDAALALGAELSRLSELSGAAEQGRPLETVLLNGQRFHHAVLLSEGSPHELLDRLQSDCQQQPGPFATALAELAEAAAAAGAEPGSALRQGVLRHEEDGRGTLLCFPGEGFPGEGGAGLGELEQRLLQVARTGSLAALGPVRYVYVQRTGAEHSRVTALWSEQGLDPAVSFPSSGDAPGSDSLLVPRPPDSRRLLSAAAEGVPLLLLHYASHAPRPLLERFYAEQLRARGFELLAAEGDAVVYQRADGRQLFLTFSEQRAVAQVTWIESESGFSELELAPALATEPATELAEAVP